MAEPLRVAELVAYAASELTIIAVLIATASMTADRAFMLLFRVDNTMHSFWLD